MEASETKGSAAPWSQGSREEPATGASPLAADAAGGGDTFAERPEVFVGAAFAGGLAIAGLLRWLSR